MKAQLAAQTELAKESRHLREQLEASQAKADELQDELSEANAALTGAKTEIKTLSTKLANARSAEASHPKIPSSAIKGNANNNRLLANAEAAVQQGQVKEDLYADLTGLIVRGIKHEQDEVVYDCIQTGRNGSKFSLSTSPPPHTAREKRRGKCQVLIIPISSSSLQAIRGSRWLLGKLRRGAVLVHAPDRPEPRSGTDRVAARLSHRGDHVSPATGGEVLRPGHEIANRASRLSFVVHTPVTRLNPPPPFVYDTRLALVPVHEVFVRKALGRRLSECIVLYN